MSARRAVAFALLAVIMLLGVPPARAHSPVSADPFRRMGCTAGLPDLVESYAVLGVLLALEQVDYICFKAMPGDVVKTQVIVPTKAAYDGANDFTMVLVGPGLPDPGRPVPGGLATGQGAIFAQVRPEDGPFPQWRYQAWWFGPRLDVTLGGSGERTYEVRVYSPSSAVGEYLLTTTGTDPLSGDLEDTPMPLPGDLNLDGEVTVDDAILALTIALQTKTIENSFALRAGDVAPPGDPIPSRPQFRYLPGDGVIDLADATRMMRRALGLDRSPNWPD
ncbi:MAG: dockerin type I repeat-containing protein [Armatimonadetes bacterium]|nr:dockerin type I repeat-containing protein [Armatimonadota bacterium]